MQKDFGKKAEVNKIIRYLTEAAFFEKWHRESRDIIRKKKYEVQFTGSLFLTIDHIWFSLVNVGTAWFLSISTFCLEIFVHKKIHDKNCQQWLWINLEHMRDGDCHRLRNLTNRA